MSGVQSSKDLNTTFTIPSGYKAIGCYFVGFEGSFRGSLNCFDCKLTSATNVFCGVTLLFGNVTLSGDNYAKIAIIFEKVI